MKKCFIVALVLLAGCAKQESESVATIEQEGQPKQTITVKTTGNAPAVSAPAAPIATRFTKTMYDQLQTGMTLSQCETVMGDKGTMTSSQQTDFNQPGAPRSEDAVMDISVYSWKNSDMSFVQVTFSKGKLSGKTASNLS